MQFVWFTIAQFKMALVVFSRYKIVTGCGITLM